MTTAPRPPARQSRCEQIMDLFSMGGASKRKAAVIARDLHTVEVQLAESQRKLAEEEVSLAKLSARSRCVMDQRFALMNQGREHEANSLKPQCILLSQSHAEQDATVKRARQKVRLQKLQIDRIREMLADQNALANDGAWTRLYGMVSSLEQTEDRLDERLDKASDLRELGDLNTQHTGDMLEKLAIGVDDVSDVVDDSDFERFVAEKESQRLVGDLDRMDVSHNSTSIASSSSSSSIGIIGNVRQLQSIVTDSVYLDMT
jgi:hypothetical protein